MNSRLFSMVIFIGIFFLQCSKEDPAKSLGFGEEQIKVGRREMEVKFQSSDGAILSGTLYLPNATGKYVAVLWHFGSTEWTRARYDRSGIPIWLEEGIAILSYDKRGVGKSEGTCCPWQDPNYFPLLADDVVAGIELLSQHPEIDKEKLGVFGFSQGGWIAPTAIAKSNGQIAFMVIGSGTTVTVGEEVLYSQLTGASSCDISARREEEIDLLLKEAGPSMFDPLPFLKQNNQPGLWIFGERDRSIPVKQSITILDTLIEQFQKPYEYIVIPNANHAWIVNGTVCQEDGEVANMLPTIFDWIEGL